MAEPAELPTTYKPNRILGDRLGEPLDTDPRTREIVREEMQGLAREQVGQASPPGPGPWDDKWKVVRPLGEGGQGFTFLVLSRSNPESKGVLKTLRFGDSAKARARMNQEVAALENLATAGLKVPKVYEKNTELHAQADVQLYFVMEFIPGTSLSDVVKSAGKLDLDQAAAIALDLAKTMEAAHGQRVAHRDLKPDNIIVRNLQAADVVIVDYGVSFNEAEEGHDLTHTTEQFGSRFLALPEMKSPGGDRRDFRSDICSTCAILYFCLTGHKPGVLQDSNGRAVHRSEGCAVRESWGSDARCDAIELFLDVGLAYDVGRRFQTWEEMTGRLTGTVNRQTYGQLRETPQEAASRLNALLVLHNKSARIAAYKTKAREFLEQIKKHVNRTKPSLGAGFDLNYASYSDDSQGREDHVAGPVKLTLQLAGHPYMAELQYRIALSGSQMVVQKQWMIVKLPSPDKRANPSRRAAPTTIASSAWSDAIWFDPAQWPEFASLQPFVDGDLVETMDTLAKQVLPPDVSRNPRQ